MERPKDFFRRDLTNEQYHDSDTYPHFSSSDIKEVVKNSALHWALKQDEPKKEPTEAMLLGSACLLYTSPSPRDAHESRMPSSA